MNTPDYYQAPQPNPREPEPEAPRSRSRALIITGGIGVVVVAAIAAALVIPRLTDSDPDSDRSDVSDTAAVDRDRDAQDIDALTARYLSVLGSNGGPEGLAPMRCRAAITRAENSPPAQPFPEGDEVEVAETLTQNFYGPDKATSRVVLGADIDGVPSPEGGDGTILAMDFLRENGSWTVCRVDAQ